MHQALKILMIVGLILLVHFGASWLFEDFGSQFSTLSQRWGSVVILIVLLLYVLLLSIPFVPGVEIGWGLMVVFGIPGVVMVYCATVIALSISFLVGQRIPFHRIVQFLDWLHLRKAKDFSLKIQPLTPEEKIHLIVQKAPVKIIPFLLRHRYLAVAVAFNLPGNALIGGGGGIGLMAGVSKLFSFPRYLGMVSLAVSPVPLVILVNSGIPLLYS